MAEQELSPVPAVILAGDRRAAKDIRGQSKVYLELEGRTLVEHVVLALQQVREVSEVWVVGNEDRLEAALGRPELRGALTKPLEVLPQFRSLYENGWQAFRRLLPGVGPEGRDPTDDDREQQVLYLSGDLPFATPAEISQFIRRSQATGCDYALGVVTDEAMAMFHPTVRGGAGIDPAYFNLREFRVRQSNLHLIKPAAIVNRFYVEEMYEHRYQKEWGNIANLFWRLLRTEHGGLRVVAYYSAMHFAGIAHRLGWRAVADFVRRRIPAARIELGCSALLRASFRFVVTDLGGCAMDIDNESEFDAAIERFDEWSALQAERAAMASGLPAGEPGEVPATEVSR